MLKSSKQNLHIPQSLNDRNKIEITLQKKKKKKGGKAHACVKQLEIKS
jgi:hypothetical protein